MGADNNQTDDKTDETSGESTTTSTDTTKTGGSDATKSDGEAEALRKALEKERSERREADKQSKALKAELEQHRKSTMSDQEKAIAEAKAAARLEVLAEVGTELVGAAVRTALVGRSVDVEAALEALDAKKFLNEEGRPDTKRISEWVERLAPKQEPAKKPAAKDMGQGTRSTGETGSKIRDRAELKTMTSREIATARREGRLDDLMRPTTT